MEINKEETFVPISIKLENKKEVEVFYQLGNHNEAIAKLIESNCALGKKEIEKLLLRFWKVYS